MQLEFPGHSTGNLGELSRLLELNRVDRAEDSGKPTRLVFPRQSGVGKRVQRDRTAETCRGVSPRIQGSTDQRTAVKKLPGRTT